LGNQKDKLIKKSGNFDFETVENQLD